jgi:hypothetical protein
MDVLTLLHGNDKTIAGLKQTTRLLRKARSKQALNSNGSV